MPDKAEACAQARRRNDEADRHWIRPGVSTTPATEERRSRGLCRGGDVK
jgi:hypothetical protein